MQTYSLCPLLGVFFSFASMVLLIFILIGNIRPVRVLQDIYFLKLTTEGLTSQIIPSLASLSSTDVNKLKEITQYTVGLWNFCYGNTQEITTCANTAGDYHFALVDIVYEILGVWTMVTSPGNLDSNNDKILTMSKAIIGLYVAAVALSFFTIVFGSLSLRRQRLFRVFTALLSFLALVATLAASAVATGLYLYIKQTLNDNQDSLYASLGRVAFGISWGAGLSALIAFIFTTVATCLLPERRAGFSSPTSEKQPFLVSETSYQAPPLPNTINDPATVGLYQNNNYNGTPNDMFSNNNNYHSSNDNQFVQPTHYNNHSGRV
jgi:hypothetical protein